MAVEAVGTNVVVPQRKTGGGGKAFASAIIPGLGQFLDGRSAAGTGYLGASVATVLAAGALNKSIQKDIFQNFDKIPNEKVNINNILKAVSKRKVYGFRALAIGALALFIANIVDAYKGGKKKA